VLIASSRAAKSYDPPPTDIRVDLFRPQTGPSTAPTPWDNLALGGVVLHQVVGEDLMHETITNGEGAPLLAEYLTAALDEAMGVNDAARGNGAANGAAHVNGAMDAMEAIAQ
jgi:hypothetical protein